MSTGKAILTRRFKASVEAVFAACTDPDQLMQWLGPNGFSMDAVEADLRVGGRFAFRMSNEKGVYAAEGIYQQIDPPHLFQLTWQWTEGPEDAPPDGIVSLVTFEFARDGEGTLLTLMHEGLADDAQAQDHSKGWGEGLAKLEAFLAASA